MEKTAVLGAGAWGTALAKVLADKGYPTALWSRRGELAQAIQAARSNERYLPGAALPPSLEATADLGSALRGAELVVLVVPSHGMRSALEEARPLLEPDSLLCGASKGIENGTLMLMSEVLVDVLGPEVEPRLTFLSGPSFAQEVASRQPTTVVVAGRDEDATGRVQRAWATDRFRVYATDDVVGVEVGGALKNVVAIAAGIVDGLGLGLNTRAALITRGLAEMGRVAAAKGAEPLTLAGLSGMGDLVLTCTGSLSRNRTVGFELGSGKKLGEILHALGHVAEGVKTTKSAHDLGLALGVELPITNEVYRVLYEEKPAAQAVNDLMSRPLKAE